MRLTEDGEAAIFSLNLLRSLRLDTEKRASKADRRRPRAFVRAQMRLQAELRVGRTVGIGEDYLMMRAIRTRRPVLLEPVPPPAADPITTRLKGARKDFRALLRFWKDEFGIDLKKLPRWSEFEEIRDLRHVVVHRLGQWQPALDPHPLLYDRMRRIAVNPERFRGPVPLSDEDFIHSVEVIQAIVDNLDGRRLRGTPSSQRSNRNGPERSGPWCAICHSSEGLRLDRWAQAARCERCGPRLEGFSPPWR